MTCRTGTALALLLSLFATPVARAHAAAHDTVDAAASTAPAADAGFLADVAAAGEQSDRGDSLGASLAFERLLADPRLAQLDDAQRSDVWLAAARVAGLQRQDALAAQRLDTALSIHPGNATARFLLASGQLVDNEVEASARNIIRAIGDTDGVPDLHKDMVWQLDLLLKDTPATRLDLLQALFDRNWKNDDIDPAALWVTLATLQVEAGQRDKVRATLERIDQPLALITLRSDKRFDRYLPRTDPRFDPVASAQRHIDRLRVQSMLAPALDEVAVELAYALLVAGKPQEVIGMTQWLADFAPNATTVPAPEEVESIGWLLDLRSRAQHQLGQIDEAVETQQLAVRMTSQSGLANQPLGLAVLYIGLHRPSMARQQVRDLEHLNALGEGARQLVHLLAALQLKDDAAAQEARDALFAAREADAAHYMAGLVADNRLDEAVVALTARLDDPMERGTALLELQDTRMSPLLPGDIESNARWEQFAQRADVKKAVRRVGRVDSYPLYNE